MKATVSLLSIVLLFATPAVADEFDKENVRTEVALVTVYEEVCMKEVPRIFMQSLEKEARKYGQKLDDKRIDSEAESVRKTIKTKRDKDAFCRIQEDTFASR